MTRGQALRTFLLTDSTISSMVGNSRIYPPPIKGKETFPAITYQEVTGKELEALTGRSGLYQCRLQVNCWDKGFDGADSLREAVKSKLLGYAGSAGTLVIAACNHAGDHYYYDGPNVLHKSICEFWIWWEE